MRRAGSILVALAIFVAAPSLATDVPVASFGNWRIFFIPDNKTYNLVGSTTGDVAGSFTVQCHSEKGAASLMIPIWTPDLKPYGKAVIPITVWSDINEAKEIDLYVTRGLLAVDVNSSAGRSDNVPIFVGILADAKQYFAFSYLGRTFEFDAKFLRVARQKFGEECSKLVVQ
jgi:hypothetical protein